MMPKLLAVDRGARFQRDEREREFAGVAMRLPGPGRDGDIGMLQQRVLDDGRVDVVRSPDDDVLGAAGDKEPALGIDMSKIAADQPALFKGAGVAHRIAISGADM